MRHGEEQYRILYEDNPCMYFTLDPAGTVLSVNRFGAEQLGYAVEELIGKPVEAVFYKDDKQAVLRQLTLLLEQPWQVGHWQLRKVRKDGSVMWVEEDARAACGSDGSLIILVVCQNITDRKRAEDALHESQEQFRAIWDNSPDIIFIKDRQGRYLDINPPFLKLTALPREQILGKTDADIFPHVQAASFRSNDLKVLGADHPLEFEEIAEHRDGLHTSIVSKFPLRDARGQTYAICGIATDITRRKRTEEALRESREQFSKAFADAAIGMALVAPNGRWLQVNHALCQLVGYSEQELLGRTFQAITHPDDLDADLTYVNQMLRDERRTYQMEKRYFHKRGHIVWIQLTVSLVREVNGSPLYFISQIQDINKRRQAEEALRFSEQRYRELVGSLDGIVWEADPADFRILYMSPQVERILGYTPEQWLNQDVTWKDVIHPEDFPMVLTTCQREIEACRNHALEYRMRTADGRIIWVRDVTTVVLEEGHAVKLRGVLFDVTDRKKAEEALARSEQTLRLVLQEREQFARDLHDRVIQSIYAIGFTLEQCQRLIPGAPEKASEKLGEVIVDLNRVIRDVRNYIVTPSTESQGLTMDELIVSLQRLIDFMERTSGSRFRITVYPEAAAALAQNQRPQLLSIAQEAMSNSLRHAHASTVSVSLRLEEDHVCFEVSDDGVGFDPQVIRPESQGLQNIKTRAKELGATFQLTSRSGHGTQIRLDIPRSEGHGLDCKYPFDGPGEAPQACT